VTICRCIISVLFVLLSLKTQAQGKVRILNADFNTYNTARSEARILQGNVKIEHQGVYLFCDTAHYYIEQNLAKAYGHVQINQADTLNVYADTLFYYGYTREFTAYGNAKLIDDNAILKSPSLTYKLDSNVAYYNRGGFMYDNKTGDSLISDRGTYYGQQKIIDFNGNVYYKSADYQIESDHMRYHSKESKIYFTGPTLITTLTDTNTIYCEKGWYNTETDESSFSGNSKIIADGQEISGDSIVYNRNTGEGEVFGHMVVTDTAADMLVTGGYGKINQETGDYLITEDPVFQKINSKDTLFLRADTLFAQIDSIKHNNRIQAYHNVRFLQSNLVGKCDSMYYSEKDSILEMYQAPVLWSDSSQLSGDTILLRIFDGNIERMYINTKAFVISQTDSIGYNQVSGRHMVGYFVENDLNKMLVNGNGKSIYYAQGDDGFYIGMDYSVCTNIRVQMKKAGIDKITLLNKPESTLYPMDQIPKDIELIKGFTWLKDRSLEIIEEFTEFRQPILE